MSIRSFLKTVAALSIVGTAFSACSPNLEQEAHMSQSCSMPEDALGRFVQVPGGSFVKGATPLYPEEEPTLRLQVPSFEIQAHEVTHQQFAAFVDATGYITDAEQGVIEGHVDAGSAVFAHLDDDQTHEQSWSLAREANWRRPSGTNEIEDSLGSFPVIHVSKRDAEAYATWAGGRLPSEIEWEFAANLGLPDPDNPMSGAYDENGPRANTWQGVFPVADLGTDGYRGIAPVGCFEPDALGLYDMIGNVWEWTDTPFGAGSQL
ncbi:MAG: SUMF1/EgtB/PvdO family nonheme iron enzyme, partial [Pseudomonadota bacterium]